jgi:hypothetical protein
MRTLFLLTLLCAMPAFALTNSSEIDLPGTARMGNCLVSVVGNQPVTVLTHIACLESLDEKPYEITTPTWKASVVRVLVAAGLNKEPLRSLFEEFANAKKRNQAVDKTFQKLRAAIRSFPEKNKEPVSEFVVLMTDRSDEAIPVLPLSTVGLPGVSRVLLTGLKEEKPVGTLTALSTFDSPGNETFWTLGMTPKDAALHDMEHKGALYGAAEAHDVGSPVLASGGVVGVIADSDLIEASRGFLPTQVPKENTTYLLARTKIVYIHAEGPRALFDTAKEVGCDIQWNGSKQKSYDLPRILRLPENK